MKPVREKVGSTSDSFIPSLGISQTLIRPSSQAGGRGGVGDDRERTREEEEGEGKTRERQKFINNF